MALKAPAILISGGLILIGSQVFAGQLTDDPLLPPGEGREKVLAVCTSCHNARTFNQLREGEQGWRLHVHEMILHGAQVRPEDIDPIMKYLSTAFGPGVPLPQPPKEVTLADGNGKDLVEGACTLCHGLDRVTAAKRSPAEWKKVIHRMTFYGAPISEDNQRDIEGYLVNHFSPK